MKTQNELKEITRKIRVVKHAINIFNTTTKISDFGMTIDEILVYLPQLSERVETLNHMRRLLPRNRETSYGSGPNATIDYRYTNFDSYDADAEYEKQYDLLSKAQSALDLVNNSAQMEINL